MLRATLLKALPVFGPGINRKVGDYLGLAISSLVPRWEKDLLLFGFSPYFDRI